VSLVSLPTPAIASHDGLDREVVSAEPHPDPVTQKSESSPERSRGTDRKAEAEPAVISKGQKAPLSEAHKSKSFPADATPSINSETAGSIVLEAGRLPKPEAESVVTPESQRGPGSEAREDKSLPTDATPSFDLEAAYSIAREVGRTSMSESEVQSLRFKSRALYLKNHLGITRAQRKSYRTAYVDRGLLAIPYLLMDLLTDSGCEWERQEDWEIQEDLEKQKDRYRQKFHSNLIEDLIIDP